MSDILKDRTAAEVICGLIDLIKENKIEIPKPLKIKIRAYAYLFDEEEGARGVLRLTRRSA